MNPTHQPATAQQIYRLRELEAKATPGPWEAYFTTHGDPFVDAENHERIASVSTAPEDYGRDNCLFIAEMRNALPALLDSHAALVADKERLEWIIQTLLSGGTPLLIERLGEHCIVSRTSIDEARAALATAEEKPRK